MERRAAVGLLGALLISGCANTIPQAEQEMPYQKLYADKEVYAMTRAETVTAIKDCESARTRAVLVFGKRKVGGFVKDIVVDVICSPLY